MKFVSKIREIRVFQRIDLAGSGMGHKMPKNGAKSASILTVSLMGRRTGDKGGQACLKLCSKNC
ncbi:MAG: hypothetical protein DME19_14730 [Verrucomicrobia bacterium]|nr:MAG: hypothetical protein DME19_14730 [Verrucomicrobiota bacterium]